MNHSAAYSVPYIWKYRLLRLRRNNMSWFVLPFKQGTFKEINRNLVHIKLFLERRDYLQFTNSNNKACVYNCFVTYISYNQRRHKSIGILYYAREPLKLNSERRHSINALYFLTITVMTYRAQCVLPGYSPHKELVTSSRNFQVQTVRTRSTIARMS